MKKSKIGIYMLALSCAAVFVLRVLQMFFSVDKDTGYLYGSDIFGIILYVILIVLAVVLIYIAYRGKNKKNPEYKNAVNMLIIYAAMLVAFAAATIECAANILLQNTLFAILLIIFGVLTCGFFFLLFAKPKNKKTTGFFILSLAPVAFFAALLLSKYLEFTKYPNQISRAFEIVMLCGFLVFFLQFTKYQNQSVNFYMFYSSSVLSVILCCAGILPEILAQIFSSWLFAAKIPLSEMFLFICCFALSLACMINAVKSKSAGYENKD